MGHDSNYDETIARIMAMDEEELQQEQLTALHRSFAVVRRAPRHVALHRTEGRVFVQEGASDIGPAAIADRNAPEETRGLSRAVDYRVTLEAIGPVPLRLAGPVPIPASLCLLGEDTDEEEEQEEAGEDILPTQKSEENRESAPTQASGQGNREGQENRQSAPAQQDESLNGQNRPERIPSMYRQRLQKRLLRQGCGRSPRQFPNAAARLENIRARRERLKRDKEHIRRLEQLDQTMTAAEETLRQSTQEYDRINREE